MADTEKITINMSVVDLGRTDLLVEQGFYSNRTDFIRTAIRNQLNAHAKDIMDTVNRRAFVVGVLVYDNEDLEEFIYKNQRLDIRVVGMLVLHPDVKPEVADQAIGSLNVFGVFRASKAVKQVLENR